ncbi:MAG: hypothetical protein QXU18_11840 [Thermoplasmatales archaeon]
MRKSVPNSAGADQLPSNSHIAADAFHGEFVIPERVIHGCIYPSSSSARITSVLVAYDSGNVKINL